MQVYSFAPLLIVLLTAFQSLAQAASWPDPEPCTGNCSYIHDPSIIKGPDGKWFRISTRGNVAIASAPNITGPWKYLGAMLPHGSKIKVVKDQEIWAPDVFLVDGSYYAYYSISKIALQSSAIGVATSKTLLPGTWTDHGSVGLPKNGLYNLVDPNMFRESPSSPFYFSFGSGWHGIYLTKLTSPHPLTQVKGLGNGTNLAYNSTHPVKSDQPSITEGSFMFWWNVNGKKHYYLFYSSGACCNPPDDLAAPGDEYKIMVCRASSVKGPFFDKAGKNCATQDGGTLVLGSHGKKVYAPGGQGVIHDVDGTGRVIMYYHYINPKIGYEYEDYQFGFNYLNFSSGWPVVVP